MRWALALLLAGCGRYNFVDRGDAGHDGAPDVPPDAGVPDAAVWFAFEDATTTGFADLRNSWQMDDYMDGTLAFTSNHDSPTNVQALSAPGAIINGQWQHLAISWDGATKRMYIDGARVASMPVATPIFYDGHDAWIGCDDNVGISEVYLGTLDDFVVYDRVLGDTEVALLASL